MRLKFSIILFWALVIAGALLFLYDPTFIDIFIFIAICGLLMVFNKKPLSRKALVSFLGYEWDIHDFCRGWLITGMTGSGKTTAAVNGLLWQVSKNCPNWGGLCIDEKGLFWEILKDMFQHLGREKDLILIEVRPDSADADWRPSHTFNFLKTPGITYSAHAKSICDVAGSLGQNGGNPFFKTQAQIHIDWGLRALDASGKEVSFKECYLFLTETRQMEETLNLLRNSNAPSDLDIVKHFEKNYQNQPPEQLGGVKQTIFNYLKHFTDPAIAEVFCAKESTFNFEDIDKGKVICLSIPQKYPIERKYLNTLLKLTFYQHALRRFDKPGKVRAKDNLIILWADEAQKIVTSNQDGISDYNTVDVLREAKATIVAATQSYLSLIPPIGDENKTKVFISNMANRITFKAADDESARIAAETLGKHETKKYTRNFAKGSQSKSVSTEEKYHLEPYEFRNLKKFEAVVHHCEKGWKKGKIKPINSSGKTPEWY